MPASTALVMGENDANMATSLQAMMKINAAARDQIVMQADSTATKSEASALAHQAKKATEIADQFNF